MIRMLMAAILIAATAAAPRDHILPLNPGMRLHPGQWVVAAGDVHRARAILTAWLATPDLRGAGPYAYAATDKAQIAKDLGAYDLQFVGVRFSGKGPEGHYAADGARGVLIHGIPSARVASFGIDLDRQEFAVSDGGNDLFQALINLETGEVEYFFVHGVA